jgi:hypothetical protein
LWYLRRPPYRGLQRRLGARSCCREWYPHLADPKSISRSLGKHWHSRRLRTALRCFHRTRAHGSPLNNIRNLRRPPYRGLQRRLGARSCCREWYPHLADPKSVLRSLGKHWNSRGLRTGSLCWIRNIKSIAHMNALRGLRRSCTHRVPFDSSP